ncbi:MAG: adenosine kinase [Lentisphaerota bacterium]
MQEIKLLGFGSPLVDILVNVNDEFIHHNVEGQKGGMELVDISVIDSILHKATMEKSMVLGGSASNTIGALAKLGIKTGFLGKVGKDDLGSFFTKHYASIGGDISSFKISSSVRTGCCLSMVTPDSERTMRTYLGAALTLRPEEIVDEDFHGYTHMHMEGYTLQYDSGVALKVLQTAKKNSLIVSLDMASFEVVKQFRKELPEILKNYVDIVFCNEDEAMQFTGTSYPEDIFNMLEGVCDVVALKLGKKGAIIKAGNTKVTVPAQIVKAVDTTGAGDFWQAGFLYGYIPCKTFTGKMLEEAGGFGARLGAEVVQVMGASIPGHRWNAIISDFNKIKETKKN